MLRDISSLRPLQASTEPARVGPNVPEDLSVLKRSSVCLIIRKYKGEQEILLIKRTVRTTDRWSGHIALPGGRQDPNESDLETAIRECREEVGLNLHQVASFIGPMEPRLVRISWGRKVAMVLCPFVFEIREGFEDVQLVPQDSEVACTFWYPLSKLYDPKLASRERIAVGDRIHLGGILGSLLKQQAGEMLFDAAAIWPPHTPITGATKGPDLPPYPWRMWGITWGIMQDARQIIDTDFTIDVIRLPTFRAPDLRLLLTIFSSFTTYRKRQLLRTNPRLTDLTNRLLVGHFAYFPWVIGTGILARACAVGFLLKWLLSKAKLA